MNSCYECHNTCCPQHVMHSRLEWQKVQPLIFDLQELNKLNLADHGHISCHNILVVDRILRCFHRGANWWVIGKLWSSATRGYNTEKQNWRNQKWKKRFWSAWSAFSDRLIGSFWPLPAARRSTLITQQPRPLTPITPTATTINPYHPNSHDH